MYRKTMAFGRKGMGMVAISALDISLWDILGQAAKQPVYRLLGAGNCVDRAWDEWRVLPA
jgi:L-rhamnonate dehydratase